MARDFVSEGFICSSGGAIHLCCIISDPEQDVAQWWPMYSVKRISEDLDVDQPVILEACMLISMSGCDLIQTKNLKNTRNRLAK